MRFLPLIVVIASVVASGDAAMLRAQQPAPIAKGAALGVPSSASNGQLSASGWTSSDSAIQPVSASECGSSLLKPPPLDPTPVSTDPAPVPFLEPAANAPRQFQIEWMNGLQFRSTDDAFRYHFGGRFDFDNGWYHTPGNLPVGASDTDQLQDGVAFRRLRLRADGTIYSRFDFVLEANFANIQDFQTSAAQDSKLINSVGVTNVWLQMNEVPYVGTVRVGHFKDPIGLERMTSANFWYYMERSPMHDAFYNPFEFSTGIMAFRTFLDDRVTAAASLSRSGRNTINQYGFGVGGAAAGTFRITGLPVYEDEGKRLIHLGFGASVRGVPADKTIEVGDRALVRSGGGSSQNPNLLDTGEFFSNNPVTLINAEFAAIRGPFALSAEYTVANTPNAYTLNGNAQVPCGDVYYQGGYIETGYFVTQGDRRSYNTQAGIWDRTVPNANLIDQKIGFGALELVLRYSYLNLISGQPTLTQAVGARAGEEHDVTLGLNWYLNPQTVIRMNYVRTRINSVYPNASGDIQGLGVRLHLDF